jgi:NAD-dependent deacetylase
MYRVLILSGAGLSAESGLKTFRGEDGYWNEYRIEDVCSVEGFNRDRELVNRFYDSRRSELDSVKPNYAHQKIAEIKGKFKNEIAVITQNVDDLLERAGCEDVIHLHGTLTDLRCESCKTVFPIDYKLSSGAVCPNCGSKNIRHNVVMFGEQAPKYALLDKINSEIELFIVIGSSGNVLPLGIMGSFHENSILNNLDPDPNLDPHYRKVIHKKATESIDEIVSDIEQFLKGE